MQNTEAEVKAAIAKVMATMSFGFPKWRYHRLHSERVIPHMRKKALRGGSIGPMTVTNAHEKRCGEVEGDLISAFIATQIGFQLENQPINKYMHHMTFTFPIEGKKSKVVKFCWHLLPAYSGDLYDPSYQNYWLVKES